ncbi:hypothetical protein BDY17DRAFT_312935 [Neohortaea acidophila]|uniref:FAD/NAD(P)-binding domain-containing protein n=1 Tax=Neohortaea acidophila TaxID=245834 RepID=A0A6A6PJR7_9PEZI|nr:uncharacterized protein BDY17DRAFT_312935 [Neohortaea acidophila]KAF2480036.1 hypothetical protein BDY17DRAFT_312935 [Neohortaea acidophila]
MASPAVEANVPAPDLNGPAVANSVDFQAKYEKERSKRLRPEGYQQYIDLHQSEQHRRFIEDPWIESGSPINTPIKTGGHTKILIVGAGWGGIQAAVKLLQAGFTTADLLLVDPAGGFGGTWWWNRYPGLMCDVESYVYLPFLEEMEYMPKDRYASGLEIRKYADVICSKYGLHERAMFQSSVVKTVWDENKKQWDTTISKKPKGGQQSEHKVFADFVVIASGVLNNPKLADLPGMVDFHGEMFHTARWDYQYTGGTQENPELHGLKGKTVAIIGTGATAVQAIPYLARYADQLYVVQRTPAAVDVRGNRQTDPATWKSQIAKEKGWWRARNANFNAFVQNHPDPPSNDFVSDGWTSMPSYSALIGTPKQVTMDNVQQHIAELHTMDYPRQEAIRQRVDHEVHDKGTAAKLKAWYPGWCKRPCFHDEYLPTFNHSHVHLIDTDGKGLDRVTERGFAANGQEYPVDAIIWSTGFRSPIFGSPAGKADVRVIGRDNIDMEELADKKEFRTLHSTCATGFPNMFYLSAIQNSVTANYNFVMDTSATHVAYILSTAVADAAKASSSGGATNGEAKARPVIEPTAEAQEAWANEILAGAMALAGLGGCTPSYMNQEGETDKLKPEEAMKMAAGGTWARGMTPFLEIVEQWRAKGGMEGLRVEFVH